MDVHEFATSLHSKSFFLHTARAGSYTEKDIGSNGQQLGTTKSFKILIPGISIQKGLEGLR